MNVLKTNKEKSATAQKAKLVFELRRKKVLEKESRMIRNARMEHLNLTAAEQPPSLASGNKESLGLERERASSANACPASIRN